MRRVLAAVFVVFLVGAVSNADAALYRGGGRGIRVEFRVKGDKIRYVKVVTVLHCTGTRGERHLNRLHSYFGTENFPSDATEIHTKPIDLDGVGRFSEASGRDGPEEEGFYEEELFSGRVGARLVTGEFRYLFNRSGGGASAECRTGHYQAFGGRNLSKDVVRFRARRR